MTAELRGGICILGCCFHLVGSSEGGMFWLRERLVVVADKILTDSCGTQRRHLHLGMPFFRSRVGRRLVGAAGFSGRHFFFKFTERLVIAELKRRHFL